MPNRIFRKIYFAFLLAKLGGIRAFFHQLGRQLYSRTMYIGMEKDLEADKTKIPCGVRYDIQLATREDMDEILQKAKLESKGSAHELIQRMWFYESGFRRSCYVARDLDTGEPCHIHWMLFPQSENIDQLGFKSRLPKLKEGEVLGENAFTVMSVIARALGRPSPVNGPVANMSLLSDDKASTPGSNSSHKILTAKPLPPRKFLARFESYF